MTWFKPSGFEIAIALAFAVAVNYNIFMIWFRPKQLLESERRRLNRLPHWFPMRDHFAAQLSDEESWISQQRIVSVFMELFVILWLGLFAMAWVFGK
jgi:hypothetical protein